MAVYHSVVFCHLDCVGWLLGYKKNMFFYRSLPEVEPVGAYIFDAIFRVRPKSRPKSTPTSFFSAKLKNANMEFFMLGLFYFGQPKNFVVGVVFGTPKKLAKSENRSRFFFLQNE